MSERMRRASFVSLVSGAVAAPGTWPLAATLPATAADLLVVNANVITVDPSRPSARAFAVRDGRVIAVGSDADILALRTHASDLLDLGGKTVLPGFNDAHVHPRTIFEPGSLYFTPWLGPDAVATIDDLVAVLRKKAAITPPGKLVAGYGYDDIALGRHPTRHDLDRVSSADPVSITHASGHITAVNTYVLTASGITAATPDPPGGAFDRDPDGSPNGVVRESARAAIDAAVGAQHQVEIPPHERIAGLLACFRTYAAKGVTSVGIAGGSPEFLAEIEAVAAAGNPVRVGFMLAQRSFGDAAKAGLAPGRGDENVRVTAIKTFQGNSLSGRTCWLREAYSDRPGYFGIPPARSQDELDRDFRAMHDAGWQIATHSNGDREIDMVLTAIERAQAANPRADARHRIEHASVMDAALLARARAAGVVLVFHSYMWEHGEKLASYGSKRLQTMHAYRTALDTGIHVAGHSDSPISAADPMLRIGDMVTRKSRNGVVYGPEQRVTVDEAIAVWTLGGAYATFEEHLKGSLSPGKLADFTVLDADPRTVAPDEIKHVAIAATYRAGTRVYDGAPVAWTAPPMPGADPHHEGCCLV